MTTAKHDNRVTVTHLLVPISLLAFIMTLLFAFQTTQILRERDGLNLAKGQQEKAFEDSQRLQTQLQALVVGTQKLAEGGNKNAQAIAARLKQLGVTVGDPNAPALSATPEAPAPVPAATEKQKPGPVKP
ncbi:MAG: hypothetical protein HGA90_03095 [Alphaproteobacteria bacterium]|nr:hypothetical protein [Alphaproteobacteria bacterium]